MRQTLRPLRWGRVSDVIIRRGGREPAQAEAEAARSIMAATPG
ncbi:hypothetical protein [Nonomuraea sp. B19D2]